MPVVNLSKLVIDVILRAQNADEHVLKDLREKILGMVSIRGAKFFKEEEVLFPALEKYGMREHPENLREEHKRFKEALSKIIKFLDEAALKGPDLPIDEMGKLKEGFISDISNHIFRETYIFYPAALEFITENEQWEKLKGGFDRIC